MPNDRHAKVEVTCEWCGAQFFARAERVAKGQGRYCSQNCFNDWQRLQKKETIWGRKDLAKVYLVGGRYCARWYDAEGKTKSTPYPRWWWEMNVGEIPEGLIILHRDENPLNIDPSNFELGEKSLALQRGNAHRKKDEEGWKSYTEKLRIKSTGRKPSDETRNKMSKSRTGNPKVMGENNHKWRGGIPRGYPIEFYQIREFIIGRDSSKCQVCGKSMTKFQNVHHRDGNKENNDQDNLLTLCSTCHNKVHSTLPSSLPIMALRSELNWNR